MIRIDGSNRVYVDAAGNVGNGDPTPNAKLDVEGNTEVNGNMNFTGVLPNTAKTATCPLRPFATAG